MGEEEAVGGDDAEDGAARRRDNKLGAGALLLTMADGAAGCTSDVGDAVWQWEPLKGNFDGGGDDDDDDARALTGGYTRPAWRAPCHTGSATPEHIFNMPRRCSS